jgi:poly-gamma-glutamate synthesis protein (capsule biosynthesis protein)
MRIIACGDIALCRSDLRQRLREADLFLANVECPLTDYERPQWTYFPTLKGSKAVGRILKDLGVDVASLANNHIADYGTEGLTDTISVLEEQEIAWVGAGRTPEQASRPLIIERGGLRIGIMALAQPEISAATRIGWGAGVLEDEYALDCITSLSKEVNIAIAYLHYGVEFSEFPTPQQVRLSRRLVDAGAKMVIGHHPHVPQGYERYKDGFIAYSLGNFLFDMADGPHRFSRLGLVIVANFEKTHLDHIEVVPVDTRGGVVRLLTSDEKTEAERYLTQLCGFLVDSEKLREAYYFTCRNNFEMYVGALLHNVFRKRNWRQARDLLVQNFWPQLFELRIDLIRFLLSGKAIEYESSRKRRPEGLKGQIWRWICRMALYLGWPFRVISAFRNS